MRRSYAASLLLVMIAAPAGAQSRSAAAALPDIDTLALRAHTRFLADDALEGRGTGTRGERVAAAYIASALQRLGLRGAAPDGGFLLPVPLRAARIDPGTSLRES